MADRDDESLSSLSELAGRFRNAYQPIIPTIPKSVVNPAEWTYERLGGYIRDFEADLDEEHEIGARLVCFGQTVTFHIVDVGYHGPDIIDFTGRDSSGNRVQLIQNIAQLSVLLIALPKLDEKPRRIGFIWDDDDAANGDA